MLKFIVLLSALLASANAFQVFVVPSQQQRIKSTTALQYTVIGPPGEDMEQDPNSVGYQQHRQVTASSQGAVQDLSQYRDYDEVLEDEDQLNVDSFSHTSGAAIMPGFHLTALCGDD